MFKTSYKYFVLSLLGLFILGVMAGRAPAYVMSAEQLLYMMGSKFSRFKTLIITQATRMENVYETVDGVVINEKIWLKAPGLYRSELISESTPQDMSNTRIADREPGGDMTFRKLLMGNNLDSIMALLTHMGINTESVSMARYEGVVVFQLGDKDTESPKLLIEKNSFLPVVIYYPSSTGSKPGMATVHFGDYQEIGKGWYPYEITYSLDDESLERYSIVDFEVNTPIDPPLSEITYQKPVFPPDLENPEGLNGEDDERLREMIELLKDKYN